MKIAKLIFTLFGLAGSGASLSFFLLGLQYIFLSINALFNFDYNAAGAGTIIVVAMIICIMVCRQMIVFSNRQIRSLDHPRKF